MQRPLQQLTFEQQIALLDQCGIRLRPGMTVQRLIANDIAAWIDTKPAENPFLMTVVALGGEIDDDDYEQISDDIWHFDTECIENHGDYIRIAERVRLLARGDLPITHLTDYVDIETDIAWLEFNLEEKRVHWDLKVEDDWVDDTVFVRFAKLLVSRKSMRQLTYLDLGGQDCLIGCATPAELKQLNHRTGLRFQWMV